MNESNFLPMSEAMQRSDAAPSHRELLWVEQKRRHALGGREDLGAAAFVAAGAGLAGCRLGLFGIGGAAGSCRAGPAMGGSGSRYVMRRSGSFGPRGSACARRAAGRGGCARTGAGAASWVTGLQREIGAVRLLEHTGLLGLERLERT